MIRREGANRCPLCRAMDLPSFTHELAGTTARAQKGHDAFVALGLPPERDELWRYTDLSDLDLSPLRPTSSSIEVTGAEVREYGEGLGLVPPGQDVFVAMNAAFGSGVRVRIARGTSATVRVSARCDDTNAAHLPALAIETEKDAQAVVVLRHTGSPGFSAPLVEAVVGDGSSLALVDVQDLGREAVHIATTRARLGSQGRFTSVAVGLGARISRLRVDAELSAPDSESDMLGLYFGEGDQHFDFRTRQEHLAARCRSDVLYNGCVVDHARAVFLGLIYVGPDGQKTDAGLTTRNLILSDGASAMAKPELEILNSDIIRCSHAAAVGPVDEDQMYYLESRGLDPDVARRLIISGFFEQVLRRVPDRDVEASLRVTLTERFRRAGQ